MPDTEFAPDALEVTAEPRNVDDARAAIASTRERISATLDAIELRIDETKQDIRRKADVLRPVRQRIGASPWTALGIAAGAGLALGLLTGGDDSDGQARERGRARRRRLRHAHESKAALADARERYSRDPHDRDRDDDQALRGAEWADAIRADEPTQRRGRASVQERLVDHLLQALTGAISDGISARVRRKMTD